MLRSFISYKLIYEILRKNSNLIFSFFTTLVLLYPILSFLNLFFFLLFLELLEKYSDCFVTVTYSQKLFLDR